MRRKVLTAYITAVMVAAAFIPAAGLGAGWDAFAEEQPASVSETDPVPVVTDPAGSEITDDPQSPSGETPAADDPQSPEQIQPTQPKPTQPRPVLKKLKTPAKPVLKNYALKTVRVTWTVDKNADKYEIYYRQEGEEKSIAKAKNTGSFDLKGLAKGKKYTVRIRSCRVQNGKTLRSKWSEASTITVWRTDWNGIKKKYSKDESIRQLIFVKYKSGSKATLYLYTKNQKNCWKQVLSCTAYTGSKGINKKKEGDRRTPTGDFAITCAFGVKKDPGSRMDYLKVNKNHYWCDDRYYNQLVDVSKQKHYCTGEHLIDYTKQYAYAMNIGYNTEGVKGKGAAIFLHCFGNYNYTLGCVAVSQKNMKKILQTCEPGTRICIYPK